MITIFKILILVLAAKSALFWIYILQVKEYRLDRFLAEYGSLKTIVKFWIFGGGRKLYVPVWTVKTILVLLISSFPLILFSFPAVYNSLSVPVYILLYFLPPLSVIATVFILSLPIYVVRQHLYRSAEKRVCRVKGLIAIGITGSYGKSSTKEFLSQLLSKKFKVAKTPDNINTEIGISRFILKNLKPDDEILIAEMGAYRSGEIKKMCEIVRPKIGILTGISEQHLALFGSREALKNAKYELMDSLPHDGLAVFNGENPHCLELAHKWKGNKILYRNAYNPRPDLPAHYGLNIRGAIEVAKYLGMTEGEIAEAVGKIRLGERMIKSFVGRNGACIIDDTYSANPDGAFAALDYLSRQSQKNKIVIMPCLIELGNAARDIHKKIGELLYKNCNFGIITTPAYFQAIKDAAGGKAILETNPEKVVELLDTKANSETAILLEGRLPEIIIKYLLPLLLR